MAIGVLQENEMGTDETYDAVAAKLGVQENPPEGLVCHTAGAKAGGGYRIFDVWESKEAYESFREERLLPALKAVIGEEAVAGAPASEIYELHDLLKP